MLAGAFVSCQHLELPSHGEPKEEIDLDVQMVKINSDSLTVYMEYSALLKAAVYPSAAKVQEIVWSCLNTEIATVNDTGLVSGIKEGEALVVAESPEGFADTCVVTVLPNYHVESVTVEPAQAEVFIGAKLELAATVLPEFARVKDVVWSSENESVATVDEKGVVTGVGEGDVNIVATSVDGGIKGISKVTVKRIAVTGVSLNKTSLSIAPGATSTLKATVEPADATFQDIEWSSDNTAVATVDANGKVTAVAVGSANITAKTVDGGFTATCAVTVAEAGGTTTLTLMFDLSKCPASMTAVSGGIPNDTYEFIADDGKGYDFTMYRPSGETSAIPTYSAKGYLVLNRSCYLGTPVIPNGTLKSLTFLQAASTNTKRYSAMTSQTHEEIVNASHCDCAEEAMGVTRLTSTANELYTYTLVDPVAEKSYYLVCTASGIGVSQISLTYEIAAPKQPMQLEFDFSCAALPGWPTANHAHVDGGKEYVYPLNGVDYTFVIADCDGASSCTAYWKSGQYFVFNTLYRYLGVPAIPGYKLVELSVQHATATKSGRKVAVAKHIEAYSTQPDAAGGHGFVKGGETVEAPAQGQYLTFKLEETEANTMYYLYLYASGFGFSNMKLTYDPE